MKIERTCNEYTVPIFLTDVTIEPPLIVAFLVLFNVLINPSTAEYVSVSQSPVSISFVGTVNVIVTVLFIELNDIGQPKKKYQ